MSAALTICGPRTSHLHEPRLAHDLTQEHSLHAVYAICGQLIVPFSSMLAASIGSSLIVNFDVRVVDRLGLVAAGCQPPRSEPVTECNRLVGGRVGYPVIEFTACIVHCQA